MTRELPALFNGDMVRAILGGNKTETRRPMRVQPVFGGWRWPDKWSLNGARETICWRGDSPPSADDLPGSPFGSSGDLLYVRERARVEAVLDGVCMAPVTPSTMDLEYEADGWMARVPWPERIKRPTIGHCLANGCYKEAARIWLRVDRVWVERVQDITLAGMMAEGCDGLYVSDIRSDFADLWDSIYSNWAENPWVWCCRFTVESTTGKPS